MQLRSEKENAVCAIGEIGLIDKLSKIIERTSAPVLASGSNDGQVADDLAAHAIALPGHGHLLTRGVGEVEDDLVVGRDAAGARGQRSTECELAIGIECRRAKRFEDGAVRQTPRLRA